MLNLVADIFLALTAHRHRRAPLRSDTLIQQRRCEERRRYARISIAAPATFSHAGRAIDCETIDIGLGGCRLRTDYAVIPGSPVTVSIDFGGRTAMDLHGHVVRRDGASVALAFSIESQDRIVPFIFGAGWDPRPISSIPQ